MMYLKAVDATPKASNSSWRVARNVKRIVMLNPPLQNSSNV